MKAQCRQIVAADIQLVYIGNERINHLDLSLAIMSNLQQQPQGLSKGVSSAGDGGSVDSIVRALYEAISFAPGTQPDYHRLRSLFHHDGKLIPPRGDRDEQVPVMSVETFIRKSREHLIMTGLEAKGFFEKEVHRAADSFGNIAHVLSTYESRHTPQDAVSIQRGINSIQLVNDRGRWWVLSVLWDVERPGNPILPRHLG